MPHHRLAAAVAVVTFAACASAQQGKTLAADAIAASHARMLATLRERTAQALVDNVFFGSAPLAAHRATLQRLGDQASWQQRLDAALAELQQGHERDGIAVLEQARAALASGTIAGDDAARSAIAFHLGVAWLRLAETQNCCKVPSIDSCVLPIRGGGLHADTEGSEHAIPCFREVLATTRRDSYWHLAARWLLNLASMTLGKWPQDVPAEFALPKDAFAAERDFPQFANVGALLGLDTLGLAGGVIVDDFDGDGCLDVITSDWRPDGQLRYWHNERDGSFADRTQAAGLTGITGGLNLLQADYDNDGHLDLLVLRGAWWFEQGRWPKSLLRNQGDGTFADVTYAAGLGSADWPSQAAAFSDFDRDGDLDLFVGNESSSRLRCPSQLFVNQGDGTFVERGEAAGVQNYGFAKGCSWGDVDGDGLADLYVTNLASENRLYHNRGDGTFVDIAPKASVTAPIASFPTWFWDFDNDGALDLFASCYATGIGHIAAWHLGVDLPHESMRLYHGDGHGGFTDVAKAMGLDYPAMPMGSNFGDLDNDGWLDVCLGTGDPHYYSLMPNLMFRNVGGQHFEQVTYAGRFGVLQKGHAVAFADWDNDGDLDVFAMQGGAYPGDAFRDAVFANPGFGNHWLAVQLEGRESNRSAIGAHLRVDFVEKGTPRVIHRDVNSGGSFGANPLRQTLGLGRATGPVRLTITWPRSGRTQTFADVAVDRAIRVVEGEDHIEPLALPRLQPKSAPQK